MGDNNKPTLPNPPTSPPPKHLPEEPISQEWVNAANNMQVIKETYDPQDSSTKTVEE